MSRHDHWLMVMFAVLASCVRFVSHPTHQVSRADVSIMQQVEAPASIRLPFRHGSSPASGSPPMETGQSYF